jgi:hypothetical protein
MNAYCNESVVRYFSSGPLTPCKPGFWSKGSMSQSARGSAITQVSVAASKNVNISINGQLAVQLLVPVYPRPLPTENRQEIDLLKAAHAQIPFTGRQTILDDFSEWCSNDRALSMRTLIGQGGAGKTRFAYELYARLRKQPGWSAYFLRFLKNEAKEVDLWREIKSKNALIIADYASDGAKALADLLRPLADAAPAGRKIRVLLLARTASWDQGWLAGLSSGRTGEDVERHFHPREPMELSPFTLEERMSIFQQTMALAAAYMARPAPPRLPLAEFARKEVAERLADPLTLMMAALMALESGNASALSLNRTRLAYEVSQKLVANRMKEAVEDHKDLFLHMAAYATLCGGLQQEEALKVLEEESVETHLGRVVDAKAFLDKLQAWLPGEKTKTWIGVIEPDIVGEVFVLVHLHNAEAPVVRAAANRAAPVVQTLVRMAQDFSFSETEEHLEPLIWLTKLIGRGEADNNLGLLFDLSRALPASSVVLRKIGLQISTTLCTRLRVLFERSSAEIPMQMQHLFAASLNTLAMRQSDAGLREAALATVEEAAALSRELARGSRDAFLPNLAASLNTLANRQSDAGLRETALATAEECVLLCRELVERNRDAFLPNLAASLNTLATIQSQAGQREASLTSAKEGAGIYRELAARNRDAFLPNLAALLNNLATIQSQAGQREASLTSAKEGAGIYRELAARNRDAFLPNLAASLNTLANRQSEAGQQEAALATDEEAVLLRRELAGRNRGAFLPDLAISLNNLANRQSAAGHQDAALAVAEEGTGLYRELAGCNRGAFIEGLTKACWTLGNILTALGRHADAAQSFAEGIRTILPGVRRYPAPYLNLCVALVRDYLSSVEEATIEPDEVLMEETMSAIGPYLKKEEGE